MYSERSGELGEERGEIGGIREEKREDGKNEGTEGEGKGKVSRGPKRKREIRRPKSGGRSGADSWIVCGLGPTLVDSGLKCEVLSTSRTLDPLLRFLSLLPLPIAQI